MKIRKQMLTLLLIAAASPDCGMLSYGASPVVTAGQAPPSGETVTAAGPALTPVQTQPQAEDSLQTDFDVSRFVLPGQAAVLVVVEGTGGADCRVFAYEKENGSWKKRLETAGYLGENGLSNNRFEGDRTTPTGLFCMNTPFGQLPALPGFPENYIQVKESHVWRQSTNRLVDDVSAYGDGEQVGTQWYREYYDYAVDMGYNVQALENRGSALFLHCIGQGKTFTSGCVAIPREQMAEVLRLYGAHGDGACYIALAPQGCFALIYDSYGAAGGLSPTGDFSRPAP